MGDGKEEKKGGKEVDDAGRGKPKKKKKKEQGPRDFVAEGRKVRSSNKMREKGILAVKPKKERAGAKGNTNASKKNREAKKSRTIKKS